MKIIATFNLKGEVRSISPSYDNKFVNIYSVTNDNAYLYQINLDVSNVETISEFSNTTAMKLVSKYSAQFMNAKKDGTISMCDADSKKSTEFYKLDLSQDSTFKSITYSEQVNKLFVVVASPKYEQLHMIPMDESNPK